MVSADLEERGNGVFTLIYLHLAAMSILSEGWSLATPVSVLLVTCIHVRTAHTWTLRYMFLSSYTE